MSPNSPCLGTAEPVMHALALATRAIPTFPCRADKSPACPGGFKSATAVPEHVLGLWRRYPGPLIGIPTGLASRADVLDLDFRNDADCWLEDNRDRLPVTRIHETRSGGLHILFRADPRVRCSAGKIAPGVDVRASGGYAVFWPAAGFPVSVPGPLAPWPDWLLKTILPAPVTVPERNARVDLAISDAVAERMIRSVLRRVEMADQGERHSRLRAAARTIGGLLQSTGICEGEAARALLDAVLRAGGSNVNERNARATIQWGLREGAAHPLTSSGHHA